MSSSAPGIASPSVDRTVPLMKHGVPGAPLARSSPFSKAGEPSMKNGPKTVDSVAPGGRRWLMPTTSIDSPSTSESRMNSWRLSSVMWPTRVRKSIPANHSSSVSRTSLANACRCLTRLSASSLKRSVLAPSNDARTAFVNSSSARLRVLIRPSSRSRPRHARLGRGMQLPVMPPVAPMLARPAGAIPPGEFYEPKWDGFRAIVFRDGDEVEIGSRKERPMTRYFPDVVAAVRRAFPPRAVIDGEIVIAGERGLDFWALQQRIHPAASRVGLLAEKTPASFVAFDLLAVGDDDLTGAPFAARRAALECALRDAAPPVHVTPITRDESLARAWFERFEGAGLDGLIAKRADLTYQPDKRVMTKIKHVRTADCVVAGYRVHKSASDAIGSLLLGLYVDEAMPASHWMDRTGGLAPVGVIG